MSVLASKRKESKFEAITFSIDLHDMLLDFMQRSFGVKDLDHLVRVRYAYGKDETEDFAKYRYLMTNFKKSNRPVGISIDEQRKGQLIQRIPLLCASMNSGGTIRTMRL